MKKRIVLVALNVLLIAALVTSLAQAGGWGGSWGLGSLWFNGYFAGLGNTDTRVELTAYGTVTAMCQNNGGNVSPGRSPVTVQISEVGVWLTDENGRADGIVEAPDPTLANVPPSPSSKEDGCPADSWTVVGYDTNTTNYDAAHLLVTSLDGTTVFFDLWFDCTTSFDANGVHTSVACNLAN